MSKSSTNSQSTNAATVESIKSIAESIGLSNLSEEACREVVSDLTFTIKSMLQDAQKFARNSKRKKLLVSDIEYSLKFRMIEPVYGFNTSESVPFRSATGGGRCVYYTEDQTVNLDDVINNNNQNVKIPNDLSLRAHWLAIEGVQPAIPENPEIINRESQKKEIAEGILKSNEKKRKTENVKVKQMTTHDVSYEYQLFFKEITEACVGCDETKRNEALSSLSNDPGLHQLLPRFALFVSEGVRYNIAQNNMAILIYLMRMARSMIDNKHLYLEKYLHELLPAILSCVLSKQLCSRPETDNHWALREFAARLIGQIVKNYNTTVLNLQTRIIKIYNKSIQSERTTFASVYGAVVGLTELGNEICESFVFPLVKTLGERITQILDSPVTQQEKMPAEKLKNQITKSVSTVLKSKQQTSDELDRLTTEFGAFFGPIFHSNLMKLRNQASMAAQAAAASTTHKTTLINPQQNRMQATQVHQQQQSAANLQHQRSTSVNIAQPNQSTPTTTKVYKVLPTNIAAIKSHSSTSVSGNKVQVINATNVQHQHSNINMQSNPQNSSDLLE